MKLTNSLLTDFAAAVITSPDSNGVQTTRGTVVSVDEEDEKKVTLRLDGSNEDCEATTMVECEAGDRVMVMIKMHKATVIGNISNPVLKKVTANKVEAGAIYGDAIRGHSITIDHITTDDIEGDNGKINLAAGTFNYGGGKLSWDGSVLTVNGTLTAGAGSKIGPWSISDTAIWKVNSTHGSSAAGAAYFGDNGLSITNKFKVSAAGVLTATGADIKGKIEAEEGKIGRFMIDSNGLSYVLGVAETRVYPSSIYLKTGGSSATTTAQLSSDALSLVPWGNAGGVVTTLSVLGLSCGPITATGAISATGNISGRAGTFSGALSGTSGSFSDNVTVTRAAGAVGAKDPNTGKLITIHSAASGNHGVYSSGDSGLNDWLIYAGSDGHVRVKNFVGNNAYPTTSTTANGQILTGFRAYNSTTLQARSQWGNTGTTDSDFDWKTITNSASDPKLKYDIKDSKVNALDILSKIKLHSFNWKVDDTHWDVGFIAPELYDIDKNLAIPPLDDESTWGVNDFYLVGVLTKAIQELTRRVNDLERRLNEQCN